MSTKGLKGEVEMFVVVYVKHGCICPNIQDGPFADRDLAEFAAETRSSYDNYRVAKITLPVELMV